MNVETVYPILEESASPKTDETRLDTLRRVLKEKADRENELVLRYPMVRFVTNWIVWITLVFLVIYCIIAGVRYSIDKRDTKLKNDAVSAYAAEQQAAADEEAARLAAEAQTEVALMELEAQDCAKALYGIHLFDEKYNYDEKDFLTYLRSAFNRVDAMGDPVRKDGEDDAEYRQRKLEYRQKKLHDVLFNGQYLASYETNTVQTKYLNIARKAVKEWHEETSKPCDFSYQFAELLERVTLVTSTNPSGYDRRWWYEG